MWLVTVKVIGDHPDQVAEQDEHEEREDEREVLLALGADIVADHVGDELVGEFRHRLQARRHQRALARADHQEDGDQPATAISMNSEELVKEAS